MNKIIFFNPSYLLSFSCCSSSKKELQEGVSRRFYGISQLFLAVSFLLLFISSTVSAQVLLDESVIETKFKPKRVGTDDSQLNVSVVPSSSLSSTNCGRSYSNTVCWGSPALSHYVLQLANCFTAADIQSVLINGVPYNAWSVGTDPTCGVYGLKWDNLNLGGNTCATFTVVFRDDYVPTSTLGFSKAGTNCTSAPANGPSCQRCSNCPDDCSIQGTQSVCPGSVGTVFTGTSGLNYQYQWTIQGNGTISGSSTQQQVSVNAGISCNTTYTLSLRITTPEGCVSTCSYTVNIVDTENPMVVSGPQNITLECGMAIPEPGEVVASDNCGTVFIQFLGDFEYPGDCAGAIVVWVFILSLIIC
jgi:hypothetical protein